MNNLVERHTDWGIEEWQQLASLNAESLNKANTTIERLRAALEEICDYDKAGGEYVITCKRISKQALNPDD